MPQLICINVSDVFTWLNLNPWGPVQSFERFWKKHDTDYHQVMKLANENVNNLQMTNDETKIKEAQKIKQNIYNVNTTNTEKVKTLLKKDFEKVKNKTLQEQQKFIQEQTFTEQEQKHLTNFINTNHGCNNENNVLESHEKQYNIQIDKCQKKFTQEVFPSFDSDFKWILVGKMDGLDCKNKRIIEIKNRTRGLFYILKEYEKIQIQLYMYLTGYRECVLIEKYKDDTCEINESYDSLFVNRILGCLDLFCENFENFLNEPVNVKMNYFYMTEHEKQKFLNEKMFINF